MTYRSRLAAFAALTSLVAASTPATALKLREPPPAPASPVTAFATDAFARLSEKDGNLAFSPASIYLALGLLEAGAGEADAAMIARVLHQSGSDKERDAALAELVRSLQTRKVKKGQKTAIVQVADGVWVRKGSKLSRAYVRRVERSMKAEIATLDFARKPERSRRAINAWIAKYTGKKIKNLLPPGSVTRSTEVVLANAVYFLGAWADAFDKAGTTESTFHRADGTDVTVPMMHRSGGARFVAAGDATMVELPYAGSNLAMDLILPADGVSLHELETSLGGRIDAWTGALVDERSVEISMPRFKMAQSTELTPLLTDLGLGSMFESIDLSRMFGKHAPDLAVSGAYHQTVIDVGEKGTEAAAATAIKVVVTSARVGKSFVADRPFLWVIRDTTTGAVIFMGRTADPS
jgi:serpin B